MFALIALRYSKPFRIFIPYAMDNGHVLISETVLNREINPSASVTSAESVGPTCRMLNLRTLNRQAVIKRSSFRSLINQDISSLIFILCVFPHSARAPITGFSVRL